MTRPRTIDCHTHILTEEAIRLLAKQSPKVAPKLTNLDARGGTLEIDGKVVQHPLPREIWDLGLRLRDMDANDVDVQVLSPNVFTFFYGHEVALTQAAPPSRTRRSRRSSGGMPGAFSALAPCRCKRRRWRPMNSSGR